MSGWGVMNQVAVKEAAAIDFPMDHFIGNWWSASEADVIPAGDGAKGYKGATFHAPGTNFKVHARTSSSSSTTRARASGRRTRSARRSTTAASSTRCIIVEAIRTAMAKFGNKPLTAEQVRWGYEHLNLTEKRLDELGLKGFTHPVKVTCEDHEGSGPVLIQQWDGKKWNIVSDWIQPDEGRRAAEARGWPRSRRARSSATRMRDCSKEK